MFALALALAFSVTAGVAPARSALPVAKAASDSVSASRATPTPETTPAAATAAAPADSSRIAVVNDSTASLAPRIPLFEQPRMVMLRSLVLPGWGQLHNHAWLKAAGFAGVELWMGSNLLRDRSQLERINQLVADARAAHDNAGEAAAISEYNARLDRYIGRQWLLAGVLTYSLLDAYVDAHFRNFDVEFRKDPALPEGFDGTSKARLSIGWHF
jgi:uncharacterized protein DUF5683